MVGVKTSSSITSFANERIGLEAIFNFDIGHVFLGQVSQARGHDKVGSTI